jgi:hypothetical protein
MAPSANLLAKRRTPTLTSAGVVALVNRNLQDGNRRLVEALARVAAAD